MPRPAAQHPCCSLPAAFKKFFFRGLIKEAAMSFLVFPWTASVGLMCPSNVLREKLVNADEKHRLAERRGSAEKATSLVGRGSEK